MSSVKKISVCIGIDLGHSSSTIHIEHLHPESSAVGLSYLNCSFRIPSIVYFADSQVIVGKAATQYPLERCIIDNKRFLGLRWSDIKSTNVSDLYAFDIEPGLNDSINYVLKPISNLSKKVVTPLDVTTAMLTHFKQIIDTYISPQYLRHYVISVPACFNIVRKKALLKAGMLVSMCDNP